MQSIFGRACIASFVACLHTLMQSACRAGTRADTRAAWLARIPQLAPGRLTSALLPRVFPLHRLPALGGPLSESDGSSKRHLALPEPLTGLTAAGLENPGVYLMENGFDALLYLGPAVPSELLRDILGAVIYHASRASS